MKSYSQSSEHYQVDSDIDHIDQRLAQNIDTQHKDLAIND